MKRTLIKRGDVFWVDFDPAKDSEIQKKRPAVVCSHDIMNENSTRVIVAPITSKLKKVYSFEYEIKNNSDVSGKVMIDQMRSVDKSRLDNKICHLTHSEMQEIGMIIKFVLGVQ